MSLAQQNYPDLELNPNTENEIKQDDFASKTLQKI